MIGAFGTLFATVYAAHMLADHVAGQTDRQAANKARPGVAGWRALGAHLLGYHLVLVGMVALAVVVLGVPLSASGAVGGLAVSVVTHGVWDRRRPVAWVLHHFRAPEFAALADHGLNGMYLADQSLHVACLWAGCLLAVAL
ncbi:DUF3307 domain-containing protein [Candidatus Frankia alpina]|uniref:DUF3307 domain-containing protein n=1 Tax=Candidatus Frankia alpina TaxID=2699483 RepID=UPI0013D35AAF|nr:DUF3307 domain-containing protein [Candidatus Frankia alpina]